MTKKMTKILGVFVVMLTLILSITHFYQSGFSASIRSIEKNTAKEIILEQNEIYKVGREVEPGYYDISYVSDGNNERIVFLGRSFSVGDQMKNYPLNRGDDLELIVEDIKGDGKGKIKLTPSKFDSLTENDKGEIILQSCGFYLIGKDIPSGEYNATFILDDTEREIGDIYFPITLYKNLSLNKVVYDYTYDSLGKQSIPLKEGEVLYFENLIDELDYETNQESTQAMGYISDSMQIRLIRK